MGETRTAGAVHLVRLGKKDTVVAERVGCDRTLVVRWKSGERIPTEAQRLRLFEAYGIDREEWEQQAARAPAATDARAVASTIVLTPSDEVVANARVLQEKAMKLCDEVSGGTPEERVSILEKSARVVAIAGKILGEDSRVSKAKILRSPEWGEIQTAIFEALKPYPDAFEAVVSKIQGLNA